MPSMHRLMVGSFYSMVRANVLPPRDTLATLAGVAQLKRLLALLDINCVFDVGANSGQFARRLRRMGYARRIVSFEPHPVAYADLEAVGRSDPEWRGYQCALGERDERMPLRISDHSSCSSFLEATDDSDSVPVRTKDVQVRTLDSMFDSLVSDIASPRILLKMDTQGWDMAVVKGAASSIGRVAALLSELSVIPLYHGMVPYYEALPFYHSLGFDLYDITPVNHTVDGRIVECDCLLVRHAGTLSTP